MRDSAANQKGYGGVDETTAARFQNFVQIHPKAKSHDGTLQRPVRYPAGLERKSVGKH